MAEASRYIPPSHAGAYVAKIADGDGDGISTFEKYAQYWGQPANVMPRYNPHGNPVTDRAMPEAYEHKSGFVEDIITGLLNKAPHVETSRLAPFWDTPNIQWEWNETHFDTSIVGGVPWHGMPRMLTSSKESYQAKSTRKGIGSMLEHDFLSTEQGRLHYANQLVSMAQSVLETACYDVMFSLFAFSHADYSRTTTTYGKTIEELIDNRARQFAAMNKSSLGLATVLEDAMDLVRANGDVQPDTIIMPTRSSMFLNLANSTEQISFFKSLFSGVSIQRTTEQARWSYQGVPVWEIQRYQMDRNDTLDLSVSTVSFGELYWMRNPLKDNPRHVAKYNSNLCNIKIYGVRRDTEETITLRKAYRHCGRFNWSDASDNYLKHIDPTHTSLIYNGNDDLAKVTRHAQRYYEGRAAKDPTVFKNTTAGTHAIIRQIGDLEKEYLHDADCADAVEALYAEIEGRASRSNRNLLDEYTAFLERISAAEQESDREKFKELLEKGVDSVVSPERAESTFTEFTSGKDNKVFSDIVDRALAAFGTSIFASSKWARDTREMTDLEKKRATVFYSLVLPPRVNVYVRVTDEDDTDDAGAAGTSTDKRSGPSATAVDQRPREISKAGDTAFTKSGLADMTRSEYNRLKPDAEHGFKRLYSVTKDEHDIARLPTYESYRDFVKNPVGAPLVGLANGAPSIFDGLASQQAGWVLALPEGNDRDSILRALTYVLRYYSQKGGKAPTLNDRHLSGTAYLNRLQSLYGEGNFADGRDLYNRIIHVSEADETPAITSERADLAGKIFNLRKDLANTRRISDPAIHRRADFVHAYQQIGFKMAKASMSSVDAFASSGVSSQGGKWVRTNFHFSPQQLRALARFQDNGEFTDLSPAKDFFLGQSPAAGRWTTNDYESAKRSHQPASRHHHVSPHFAPVTLTSHEALSSVMSLGDHHMYRAFKDGNRYNNLGGAGKRSRIGARTGGDYAVGGSGAQSGVIEYRGRNNQPMTDQEIRGVYKDNVTENFGDRWRAAESGNNPIKTLLIRMYLGCRYVGRTFENFEKYHVPIPFDFLLVRLEITLEMASGLVLKAGFDTARTAVNKMNLQGADNAVTKFTYIGLTYMSKCIIIKPKNIARLNHIFCRRYISGLDISFYENAKQFNHSGRRNRLQTSNNAPQKKSIMVFMLPYRSEQEYGSIIDVRGFWDPRHYGMSVEGDRNALQFAGALYYNNYYGFHEYARGRSAKPVSSQEAYFNNTARKVRNTIAIQGYQITYDPDTLNFDKVTTGQGHLGKWARTGLRDAMNLNGAKMFPGDPKAASFTDMAHNSY